MYQVDIKYRDLFTNEEATERLYFNLTAFELAEIAVEFEDKGGIEEHMKKSLQGGDYKDAFQVLKLLFINGYGRREEREGRSRFVKRPEWLHEILPSPEFESFYLRLTSDTEFATKFWNGLVSEELLKKAKEYQENGDVQARPDVAGQKYRELPLEEQVKLLQAKIAEKTAANEV